MDLVAIVPKPHMSKKLIPDVGLIKSVNAKLALGVWVIFFSCPFSISSTSMSRFLENTAKFDGKDEEKKCIFKTLSLKNQLSV